MTAARRILLIALGVFAFLSLGLVFRSESGLSLDPFTLIFSLLWMIFWSLVIASALYFAVTFRRHDRAPHPQSRDILDVARERYARGELSREEYESVRRELE